jgi:hypothetical protein
MRKLIVLSLVFAIALHQPLKAQYYFYNDKYYDKDIVLDLGATFGVMNGLTDLGGKKTTGIKKLTEGINWKTASPSFGGYIMAMYKDKIGLRLEATFGEVSGADSLLKHEKKPSTGRYESNLSFKSRISELQLGLEIHPLMFLNYDEQDPPRLSPYTVIGAGYYSFDPQAQLNGQWYSLQPLSTEGQGFSEYPDRKPYKLSQFNISTGLGIKYEISSMFNARLEANYRFLFTDYLDDVSTTYIDPNLFRNYLPTNVAAVAQRLYNRKGELKPSGTASIGDQRGSPSSNDSYFTIQVKIGVIIGRQRR